MNPYPLIYCPQGVARPACCPSVGGTGLLDGKGADVASGGKGGGVCYGGPYRDGAWQRTPAGWYVLLDGHKPQHLGRAQSHPRILRWQAVPGHLPETYWRVPVVLAPLVAEKDGAAAACYVSALERVWYGDGWKAPTDLEDLHRSLLAIAEGVPLADTAAERDHKVTALAIELLELGQWVDGDLLAAAGWLTEALVERVILAACGAEPEAAGV